LPRSSRRRAEKTDRRGDEDRGGKKANSFHDGLAGSLGREGSGVKRRLGGRCALCTSAKRLWSELIGLAITVWRFARLMAW
jgi:hypothetical protein